MLKRNFNKTMGLGWKPLLAAFFIIPALVFCVKYFGLFNYQARNAGVMKAIPKDAALVVQVKEMGDVANAWNKVLPGAWDHLLFKRPVNGCLGLIDSLCRKHPEQGEALRKCTFATSLHVFPEQTWELFMAIDLSGAGAFDLPALLKEHPGWRARRRQFNEEDVFDLRMDSLPLTLAVKNHLLLLASNAFLVEQSLQQMQAGNSLSDETTFAGVCKKLPEDYLCTLYLHGPALHGLAQALQPNGLQPDYGHHFEWAALDVQPAGNNVVLKGYVEGSSPEGKTGWKISGVTLKQWLAPFFAGNRPPATLAGLQLDGTNLADLLEINGTLTLNPQGKALALLAWQDTLGQAPALQPWVFADLATGEAGILVEDTAHCLRRYSESGKRLWQRLLDGPILGQVHAVDFYGDGNTELVFNTPGRIYVLQPDGSDAGNYPHGLSWPATAGLCITDFDGNKNYKFFVPCSNGRIYGFEMNGKPLNGWSPSLAVGSMHWPLQWIENGKRKFFLAQQDNGTLSFFGPGGKKVADDLNCGEPLITPVHFSKRYFYGLSAQAQFQLGFEGKMKREALPGTCTGAGWLQEDSTGYWGLLSGSELYCAAWGKKPAKQQWAPAGKETRGMAQLVTAPGVPYYLVALPGQTNSSLRNRVGEEEAAVPEWSTRMNMMEIPGSGGSILLALVDAQNRLKVYRFN